MYEKNVDLENSYGPTFFFFGRNSSAARGQNKKKGEEVVRNLADADSSVDHFWNAKLEQQTAEHLNEVAGQARMVPPAILLSLPERSRSAHQQTLEGSFSAVSTATIARNGAFFHIFRDLQDFHAFAPLRTQNFKKIHHFCQNLANFPKSFQILFKFREKVNEIC